MNLVSISSFPTLRRGSRGPEVRFLQEALNLIPDGIFGPITEEAVKDFQKPYGLVPDGIVGRHTWNKIGQMTCYCINHQTTTIPRSISEIILHCTATPEGHDYTVDQVRRWHVDGNGWADIGYHYLIRLDGTIEEGRPLEKIGAHCTGHNSHSIGVCYVGGCDADGNIPKDTRTPQQREALRDLVEYLRRQFPKASVHCHNEFANKACPSFNINQL